MYERIRDLRKNHLHLSQEKFAERLGVSRAVIANIELNTLSKPEQKEPIYKLICKEFNVNEDWLRTGAGGPDNMFLPNDASLLMNMGKLADSDNRFKKFCVETLMNAPDDFFDYVYNEFLKFEQNEKKEKE